MKSKLRQSTFLRILTVLCLLALPVLYASQTAFAAAGDITLVTKNYVNPNGGQTNNESESPSVSADGRYVAFASRATNLTAGDTNGCLDIFVVDRLNNTATRVSVASDGTQANNSSWMPVISADGNFVAFQSGASNLVPMDFNNNTDVFLHNMKTGETRLVSVNSNGTHGDNFSDFPTISADGRYVAYESLATNLLSVPEVNGFSDIYLYDRIRETTMIVSQSTSGAIGNSSSSKPFISPNGRYILFGSLATNFDVNDTNGTADVYVHDIYNSTTTRVSVATNGTQSNDSSTPAAISSNGRYIVFNSFADNLVSGDTNGASDIFVRDQKNGTTQIVTVATDGTISNSGTAGATISASGRLIVFCSSATNLMPSDWNASRDCFIRDTVLNTTTPITNLANGAPSNNSSRDAFISADGHYAAFTSSAFNLVPNDLNNWDDIFMRELAPVYTFADVPLSYWANNYIERLYNAGVTGGCSSAPLNYCPSTPVTRAQMAIFIQLAWRGWDFQPQLATGIFSDVPVGSFGADFIEQLYNDGITTGCGGNNYCPNAPVTRAQMAVFLLLATHGAKYNPPAASGVFTDVPTNYWAAAWIEQLAAEGITGGCGGGNYCPDAPVTRGQMAVFLVKTFNMP